MRKFFLVFFASLLVTSVSVQPVSAAANNYQGSLVFDNSVSRSLSRASYSSALGYLAGKGYPQTNFNGMMSNLTAPLNTNCPTNGVSSAIDWSYKYCYGPQTSWKQQGITGSGESQWGTVANRNILLTSWHSTDNQNANLYLVDLNAQALRYAQLVRPCSAASGFCSLGSSPDCGSTHAGGLAWYKNQLFVADTECIYVFNVDLAYVVNGTYIIPTTQHWKRTSSDYIISTLSLDLTSSTPQLVTAEYQGVSSGACDDSEIVRWQLDAASGALVQSSTNVATAYSRLVASGLCAIQGVAAANGLYFLTSSNSPNGTDVMYRRQPNSSYWNLVYAMPATNVQDLYMDYARGRTWTLTEDPSGGILRVMSFTTSSIMTSPAPAGPPTD